MFQGTSGLYCHSSIKVIQCVIHDNTVPMTTLSTNTHQSEKNVGQ